MEQIIIVTTINSIAIAILAIISILDARVKNKIINQLSGIKPVKVVTGNLVVKHWAGIISHEKMYSAAFLPGEVFAEINPPRPTSDEHMQAWAREWNKRATKAEARNNTLLVFEIPKDATNELIMAIERFLQERPETQAMKGPSVELTTHTMPH